VTRFEDALAAIDAENAERPDQLAHSHSVYEWVTRLRADAPEALLLAARACHIRRWEVPRSSYPDGRAGYLKWRRALYERHATLVGEVLARCGYAPDEVERVQSLVAKRDLRTDADAQTLEDALCLEFIEHGYDDLAARTEPGKMATIVDKTLAKMSIQGRAEAARLMSTRPT
jgi:hypothetical protein